MALSRKRNITPDDRSNPSGAGEVRTADAPAESTTLVIGTAQSRPLSRDQRAFNRLIRLIAEFERSIVDERNKLELFLGYFHDNVSPHEQTLAQRQVELARALAAANGRLALGRNQTELVREMLLDLCSQAFEARKPDAETEAFHDEWSEISYRDEVRRECEYLKQELADDLRSRFGVHVDIPEDSSPETMARFYNDLREKVRAAEADPPPAGRATNATKAGRTARRGRVAATGRSLREIYLSLAKVLHPDVVSGDEGQLREESMKEAVRAYRESDVTALLELELRWVARDQAGCNALPDDALRRYIPALREQAARLERSLQDQACDPRYRLISHVAFMDERWGLVELKKRAQALRLATEDVEHMVRYVKSCKSKAELLRFVRDDLEMRVQE